MVNGNDFPFDHILHAQPNRQRSVKWFPEMVLHQNKCSLRFSSSYNNFKWNCFVSFYAL